MNFPPPNDRQAKLIWAALTGLALALMVALVLALLWGLGQVLNVLSPVLWPLAVAGVLAYLLDPLVDWFEKRGAPRTRAIIYVFAIAFVILVGLFSSVVPQIINETQQLARTVPAYANRVQDRIENWVNNPPRFVRDWLDRGSAGSTPSTETNAPGALVEAGGTNVMMAPDATTSGSRTNSAGAALAQSMDLKTLTSATGLMAEGLKRVGSWLFGQVGRVASWFGVLAGLSLVPVYAFYLLLEKRGIQSNWTDYLPVSNSKFKDELVFLLDSTNNYLIAFFRGQVLVAICDGIMYTAGFLIIGLPYAVLLGAMSVGLTMIPFLGAIITCLVALVLALVQFGDWQHPLYVMAVFGVVQSLEGLVVSPKIMGDRVGLHPVTIIIAVMAGTTLMGGILGGVLAIPLTAVLGVVLSRYVWKRPTPEQTRAAEKPAKA
jgi:predicted PurR-regulated permease PerM